MYIHAVTSMRTFNKYIDKKNDSSKLKPDRTLARPSKHKFPPKPGSYLQLYLLESGNQCLGLYINHTPGQAPCSGTAGQHKRNPCLLCVCEVLFCLFHLFCLFFPLREKNMKFHGKESKRNLEGVRGGKIIQLKYIV